MIFQGYWETNKMIVILHDFFFHKSKVNYFTDGRMVNEMNAVSLPRKLDCSTYAVK